MVELAIVADSEESFTGYVARTIAEQWKNNKPRTVQHINSLDDFMGEDLFGEHKIYILNMGNRTKLPDVVTKLEALNGDMSAFYDDGLIITTQLAKNTLKRLMAAVEGLQGRVYVSEKKKVDTSKRLIDKINLNRDAKSYALAYAGEDYASLVPLIEAVSAINPQAQHRITVAQIALRMPQPPGSVPVWELEAPFFNGNIKAFIETNRRVPMTANKPMLANSYLLKQLENIMLCQAIGSANMSSIAGLKGYPLKKVTDYAKKLHPKTVKEAVKKLADCEYLLKGGSRVNGLLLFEATAMSIMTTFKNS